MIVFLFGGREGRVGFLTAEVGSCALVCFEAGITLVLIMSCRFDVLRVNSEGLK